MSTTIQDGYDQWAHEYDEVSNKTRDLDKIAFQKVLSDVIFHDVLEIGCGTGKNTVWLVEKGRHITAVDFSNGMMQQAKKKITAANVIFVQSDITKGLPFPDASFDLVTCNLILEHIPELTTVFSEANRVLKEGGKFFISELHPIKQYLGSKARFDKNNETITLDCFVHHASEFYGIATQNGFSCSRLDEWFDDDTSGIPRLISFLFQKDKTV